MAKEKEESISTISTKKFFFYKRGEIHLTFDLNVDNSKELRNFLSCLIAAKADVEKELEGMKN